RAGRIREWLLLLLRFAITCDPKDQAAAFAMADEIDALGLEWRPSAPSFFRHTSGEVCAAITVLEDPRRITILEKHIARIDDPRLRRAFHAAVDLERGSRPAATEHNRKHSGAGWRSCQPRSSQAADVRNLRHRGRIMLAGVLLRPFHSGHRACRCPEPTSRVKPSRFGEIASTACRR